MRRRPVRRRPPAATGERIFATKAALTTEINEIARARSRFGPADLWVIRYGGGGFCRGELGKQGLDPGIFAVCRVVSDSPSTKPKLEQSALFRGQSMQVTFFLAFVAVLALIGLAVWLVRRFAGNRLGANTNGGRMPRLAVTYAAVVDTRRKLVLVRRDNVEHLVMIGGPSDIVIETNIVRSIPGAGPDAATPRGGRRRTCRGSRRFPTPETGPTATISPSRRCRSRRQGRRGLPSSMKRAARRRPCAPTGATATSSCATRWQASRRSRSAIRWPAGPSPAPNQHRHGQPHAARRRRLVRRDPVKRPSRRHRPRRRFARPSARSRRRPRPHPRRIRIWPKWRSGSKPRCAGRPAMRRNWRRTPAPGRAAPRNEAAGGGAGAQERL